MCLNHLRKLASNLTAHWKIQSYFPTSCGPQSHCWHQDLSHLSIILELNSRTPSLKIFLGCDRSCETIFIRTKSSSFTPSLGKIENVNDLTWLTILAIILKPNPPLSLDHFEPRGSADNFNFFLRGFLKE